MQHTTKGETYKCLGTRVDTITDINSDKNSVIDEIYLKSIHKHVCFTGKSPRMLLIPL